MNPLGWPKELLKRTIKASTRGFDCGWHLSRYTLYGRVEQFLRGQPPGRILSISGSDVLGEMIGRGGSELVPADYPEHTLLKLGFPDESFDYVVCDQVLEHVEGSPQLAVDEQRRVLKKGGWLVLTTCFINPIHLAPVDLWRFTPYALRYLCREFEHVEEADGWGNLWVPLLTEIGVRDVRVPHWRHHPLHKVATRNDPRYPVTTWVIARK